MTTPGILPDWQIAELAEQGMITPFVAEKTSVEGCPSFGLSHAGYDCRLGSTFKTPVLHGNVWDQFDPCEPDAGVEWRESKVGALHQYVLKPGHMVLAQVQEHLRIPPDIFVDIKGKSTNARCAILTNVTTGEPGWEGILTLEISNCGHLPVVLTPGMGIVHLVFHRMAALPANAYAGKYQGQTEVTAARAA